jgi:hypothetical protein
VASLYRGDDAPGAPAASSSSGDNGGPSDSGHNMTALTICLKGADRLESLRTRSRGAKKGWDTPAVEEARMTVVNWNAPVKISAASEKRRIRRYLTERKGPPSKRRAQWYL